jgi:hypothetical protein
MARMAWGEVEVKIRLWEGESAPGTAGGGAADVPHTLTFKRTWTSGNSDSSQIDRVWSTNAGAAASPGTDLDLVSTSSLPSKLDSGDNVQFSGGVVLVAVSHDDATGDNGDIRLGGSSNPWTGMVADASDVISVAPGGFFLWIAPDGSPPTAGTADILRVLHNGVGTVAAQMLIAGRSA